MPVLPSSSMAAPAPGASATTAARSVHMREVVEAMKARLEAGASAVDVAVEAVALLEDSGLYVAGRGASPNLAGAYELDASLMDGATRKAGAVAALQGFRSPVRAARAVMDHTPHVMLVGEGAALFAHDQGLEAIADEPEAWFTHAGKGEDNHPPGTAPDVLSHGTVGCCVLDSRAVSPPPPRRRACSARCPDASATPPFPPPEPGPTAASPSRAPARANISSASPPPPRSAGGSDRGRSLAEAARAVIDDIGALGGDGGLIALDADGNIAHPFNSQGMKRAWLTPEGEIGVEVFGT
jgi:beta-aspartyl-peptidase (threonine type)